MRSSRLLAVYWIFILLSALSAISCKKDGAQLAKVNDELPGKWNVESNKIVYSDKFGQKEYEDVLERLSNVTELDFQDGRQAKISNKTAQSLHTAYLITEEQQGVYIELRDADVFDAKKWEITDVTTGKLIWKANFPNIKYEDKETGEIVEAHNAEVTLSLVKQ